MQAQMSGKFVCWKCGFSLKEVPRPISRLMQCKSCGADLHVCRLCRYYKPQVSGCCDHDLAEPAREIDLANFCQYFSPTSDAYQPHAAVQADDARTKLAELFGDIGKREKTAPEDPLAQLKALFGESGQVKE